MKYGKSISIVAAGLTAIGFAGFASSGAQAASANGTANATIVQAIGISAVNTLEFGDILNGAANTGTALRKQDIVINEIMYHPISNNDDDEYFYPLPIAWLGWEWNDAASPLRNGKDRL